MNKFFTTLLISICFILISFPFAFSEDITITTYFPSPYGSYATLRSDQMAVGTSPAYKTGVLTTNNLIVEGSIGVNNPAPAWPLEVNGNIAANDVYLKNKGVWVGGMSWCIRQYYTPTSGTIYCASGTTYSWFNPVYGASPYDIPTSGSYLCCR